MRTRYLLAVLIVAGSVLPSPSDELPNKERIDRLIEQLGSGNFVEREKATKELAAIGVPALEGLRKATKSDDAEVRKRAENLLPQIEIQAESTRVLAPKRVHLTYKDTPLPEAVADIQKKSGYTIYLHDPDGKLKERKITLDAGETTFWHAVDLFCAKAELDEPSMEELLQALQPRGGGPGAPAAVGRPGRVFMPGMNEQIILKDGKAKKVSTDDRGAVRLRAPAKGDLFGKVPEGEILVPLEVTSEPKLQLQIFQSIRIDKATDDQDQELTQVIPQVEGAAGIGGNLAIAPPGAGVGAKFQMQMQFVGRARMGWGGLSQQLPVQLKKGGKDAKTLKELKGGITVQLLTEPRPLIAADKLDKAAGKTFKGDEGGSIKIVKVASEEKLTTILVELEQPPYDKVAPVQPNVFAGAGAAIGGPVPGMKLQPVPPPPPPGGPGMPVPAPRPVAIPIRGGGPVVGDAGQLVDSLNGLSLRDDKDNTLPIDGGRSRMQVSFVQQANGGPKRTIVYTLVYPHGKDKSEPAKVVYLGRKRVTVEIPFALKDVPLP